jgi:DNA primase
VVQSGLALKKEGGSTPYDRFRDRVMFTLFDATGRPIGFAGRGMEGDAQPKYLNSPETLIYHKSRVLYGLHKARAAIKDENRILVVEGYMDYLSLYQAGICNVVATSGTALTQEHGTLIRRFTERVTLVFDGDKAGITAAERAIFTLAPHSLAISVLLLPGDDDPDSFVKREGAERFRAVLTEATDALSFLLKRFTSAGELDTPQGKSAVLNRLKPLLETTADAVVRAEYIKTIAERIDVAQQLIYRLLPQVMQSSSPAPAPTPTLPQRGAPVAASQPRGGAEVPDSRRYGTTLEGNFVRILVCNPQLIPQARTYITPETFTDAFTKNLYSTITKAYDLDPALPTLLQHCSDEQTKSIVAALLSTEEPQEHAQQDLTHAIIELQKKFLRTTLRQLRLQLQSNPGNRRLLEKHKELSLQLNQLKQS